MTCRHVFKMMGTKFPVANGVNQGFDMTSILLLMTLSAHDHGYFGETKVLTTSFKTCLTVGLCI